MYDFIEYVFSSLFKEQPAGYVLDTNVFVFGDEDIDEIEDGDGEGEWDQIDDGSEENGEDEEAGDKKKWVMVPDFSNKKANKIVRDLEDADSHDLSDWTGEDEDGEEESEVIAFLVVGKNHF